MNNTEKIHHYIKQSGIEFSYEEFKDNNMSRSHTHNTFELYYLIEGSRKLLLQNNFYQIKKGDILLISPGVMHKTLNAVPAEYKRVVINFPPAILKNIINKSQFAQRLAAKDAIIVTMPGLYENTAKESELIRDIYK